MPTNRNTTLAEKSAKTPAGYNRRFARQVWRNTFTEDDGKTMSPAWHVLRQPGQAGSFRMFTGRTINP